MYRPYSKISIAWKHPTERNLFFFILSFSPRSQENKCNSKFVIKQENDLLQNQLPYFGHPNEPKMNTAVEYSISTARKWKTSGSGSTEASNIWPWIRYYDKDRHFLAFLNMLNRLNWFPFVLQMTMPRCLIQNNEKC